MYECLREAHSLPQLHFSEAKLQLGTMPRLYVLTLSYNTDTPTFSDGESIGEANKEGEKKITISNSPIPIGYQQKHQEVVVVQFSSSSSLFGDSFVHRGGDDHKMCKL